MYYAPARGSERKPGTNQKKPRSGEQNCLKRKLYNSDTAPPKTACFSSVGAYNRGRVDAIWLSHLAMLCVPGFSPLSIEECHNILPCKRASTPLTAPDVRISLIRLFSKTHSTDERV
jgi:hypothetical protein